ncbi:MAG: S26 family signal peptidase [Treponema sp.]|nr:S26 family signal peptidase [Treponema sp.]
MNKRSGLFWLAVCSFILAVNRFVFCLAIVNGDSMRDALHDGDIVFVLRRGRPPQTGDIVITNKNNPFRERLVKRVAAVDRERGVYLIGDNSGRSRDSREIGFIPLPDIMGAVVWRLYPNPASFVSGGRAE